MKIKNSSENLIIKGPAVAVDALIFAIRKNKLHILLAKINQGPYKNKWALPGGLVKINETLDATANNILKNKVGIRGVYLEQLYTFGSVKRDIRGRSVSVAYFALVDSDKYKPKKTSYYSDIGWKSINNLPILAFDHKQIIKYGIDRLRNKIEYTNVAYALLPKEFTLTEMQKVYEIILGKKLDKRNFRKKIESVNIIEPAKKTKYGMKHRPAELYKFKKRNLIFTK